MMMYSLGSLNSKDILIDYVLCGTKDSSLFLFFEFLVSSFSSTLIARILMFLLAVALDNVTYNCPWRILDPAGTRLQLGWSVLAPC